MFDTHAHITSDDPLRYPARGLTTSPPREALDNPLTVERLLTSMDQAGVDRAMLVQKLHSYGFDNSYVVDAAAAHPHRLFAVCGIDGRSPNVGDDVRHWVRERGAVGIRMTANWSRGEAEPVGQFDWLTGDTADLAWRAAEDDGVFVVVHFYRWNRADGLAAVGDLLERFRSVRIVLDHVANVVPTREMEEGVFDDALGRLVDTGRVFLKVTPINTKAFGEAGLDGARVLAGAVKAFGAERICWGSDVTNSPGSYADLLAQARSDTRLLDATARAEVLDHVGWRLVG